MTACNPSPAIWPKQRLPRARFALAAVLIMAVAGAPRTATGAEGEGDSSAIRQLEGRHIRLMTDLPISPDIEELPKAFDAACPQWARYFRVADDRWRNWHVTGCLMGDESTFRRAALLPETTPPFLHGYAERKMLWWREQPSSYYRRHLMLHEGVHAFMQSLLGGSGPPWYREAMAELLATHRWHAGHLTVRWFPQSRDEVPMLGRIRLVRDAVAAGRGLSISRIMGFTPRAFFQNENYAWCWALAALLDGHPAYQGRFRQLPQWVADRDFNRRFRELYARDWQRLQAEWQLFVADIEHGYDFERTAIDFSPGARLAGPTAETTIRADRGWQNTGWRLEAGRAYELTATGRYQVAQTTKPWWCEPGGVSIRYYRGRPLGMLLAAVAAGSPGAEWVEGLLSAKAIGRGNVLRPERTGTLFLRINESAGRLADNRGTLRIRIRRLEPTKTP